MAYVVTEQCIACRYTDCVAVCPVDCFRGGPTMLVIAPDECIDCGICVPECPAQAIQHESLPAGMQWLPFNARYAALWPALTAPTTPLEGADERRGLPDKHARYFEA